MWVHLSRILPRLNLWVGPVPEGFDPLHWFPEMGFLAQGSEWYNQEQRVDARLKTAPPQGGAKVISFDQWDPNRWIGYRQS